MGSPGYGAPLHVSIGIYGTTKPAFLLDRAMCIDYSQICDPASLNEVH